jgi:hypothetical protein
MSKATPPRVRMATGKRYFSFISDDFGRRVSIEWVVTE